MAEQTVTRAEHLAWAKARALDYLDRNEPSNALSSMLSDLAKHDAFDPVFVETVGMMGVQRFLAFGVSGVREWIEGFN